MAVLSDYTSGTISLANGSVTVTGTGTLFEVTRFREGDTLQIQNLTAVIASVDSDTQLTLTEPWTGTSIVDGPYRARQLADGTRVGTQAATLIELLGDGTLAGIAALGVEEGKSLVGGPAGQYELVDTSTFGIQDPNGSVGKLAALTLGNRQILQTDAAGSLKSVGLTSSRFLLTDANGDVSQPESIPFTVDLAGSNGNMDFAQIQQKNSFVMANNSVIWFTRSGLLLVNDISDGSVGLFVLGGNGGGSVTKLSGGFRFDTNLGTAGKVNVFFASNEYNHYEIQNLTGGPVTLRTIFIVTREAV